MRNVCLNAIHRLAKEDSRIVFVGSDLGNGTLEAMQRELPERFFMEGVSEAHLVGMCAGLALDGFIPYFNTIATFITRRCYEQLVLDLGLEQLPVRIIGNGGGLVYAPLGPTHEATNDIAILRSIPGFNVFCPADAEEMARLMPHTVALPGPAYIRLAKGGDPIVSRADLPFIPGRAQLVREGGTAVLVTTGIALGWAREAAEALAREGVECTVLHCHTVKPLDTATILEHAARADVLLTVEEHSIVGGLGSAVAEALAEADLDRLPRFRRLALPDAFPDDYGSQAQLLERYSLTAAAVADTVRRLLAQRGHHGRAA